MGFFNCAGFLSKLTINEEDPITLFFLLPSKSIEFCRMERETVMHIGYDSALMFHNLCLPIHGYYDQCGGIKKIKKDENVKVLEKYFGIPIKKLCKHVRCRSEHESLINSLPEDKKSLIMNMSYGMELTEIYRYFGVSDNGYENSRIETGYDLFAEELRKREDKVNFSNIVPFRGFNYWNEYFIPIYKESIISGKLREEFSMYHHFQLSMYSLNTYFFPCTNGHQFGDDDKQLLLVNKTKEILGKRISQNKTK